MNQLRNVQRGTVFIMFVSVLISSIIVIIRLCKNQIDHNSGQIYQQKNANPKSASNQNMDNNKENAVSGEEPSKMDEVTKRINEFELFFAAMTIPFVLNLIVGTSFAFNMTVFFFVSISVIIFNNLKLHRKCIGNKWVNVVLEHIWVIFVMLWFLNIWTTIPATDPYFLSEKFV